MEIPRPALHRGGRFAVLKVRVVMNLSHDALRDLTALAELKSEGTILDRQLVQHKSHVINDHRHVDDSSLEDFAWHVES